MEQTRSTIHTSLSQHAWRDTHMRMHSQVTENPKPSICAFIKMPRPNVHKRPELRAYVIPAGPSRRVNASNFSSTGFRRMHPRCPSLSNKLAYRGIISLKADPTSIMSKRCWLKWSSPPSGKDRWEQPRMSQTSTCAMSLQSYAGRRVKDHQDPDLLDTVFK